MQQLSLRKYAESIGVSHTAVAKALKAGYIAKGYDPETKKIIVDLANTEWGNEIKEKNKSKTNVPAKDVPFDESNLTDQDYESLDEGLSFSEARRRKEIYNAEIARVEALRVQKLYVEKQSVYNALFAFGAVVRNRLLAIPDRHVDNIMAAKNRFDAHNILTTAIYEALVELSDTESMTSAAKIE